MKKKTKKTEIDNKKTEEGIKTLIDLIAQEAAKERVPNELRSNEEFQEQLQHAMQEGYDEYAERLSNGARYLLEVDRFPFSAHSHAEMLNDPDKLESRLSKGMSMQECLAISDKSMIEAYNHARDRFRENHPTQAADILLLLCALNPLAPSYWLALAMAEHRKGDLHSAAMAYSMGLDPDATDLNAYFYAAECLQAIDCSEEAIELLKEALEACEKRNPADQTLQTMMQRTIDELEGEIS